MNRFVLFLVFIFSLAAEKTDILFHLHDAGETYALLPVIRELKEVDYLIITTGVAKELTSDIGKEHLRSFQDLASIAPKKVITGVASSLQGETLDYFNSKAVLTYAYWDNFNAEGSSPYFETAHQVERKADVLLLPCKTLTPFFAARPTQVVGHPTLDRTVQRPKIALWIGGYGKEYEEAFDLFQKGKKEVQGVVFLIQHHPKTGLKNNFTFQEALSIADLVICHQSTAAFQALAAKKPVLHVIPPGQMFDSLPLQKGLAKRVDSAEQFAAAVQNALQTEVESFFALMGIPENSTAILQSLLEDPIH